MPNFAITNLTFNGPDARKLYDNVKHWTSFSTLETDFGDMWLGNIAINSGLVNAEHINDPDTPRCRGYICDISEFDDDCFEVQEETAWVPMTNVWQRVVDLYNYDVEITFVGEESGNQVYLSNDPIYVGKYNVDVDIESDEIKKEFGYDLLFSDDLSEQETIDFLKRILNAYSVKEIENNLNKLIEQTLDVIDEDAVLGINEYEEISVYAF